MLYLGVHHSISDGIVDAIKDTAKIGGNAIQIFTSPPQSMRLGKLYNESEDELEEIGKFIKKSKFPFFIHGKYMISFTRPLGRGDNIYLETFSKALNLSVTLNSIGVVNHFGSIKTASSRSNAISNTVRSIERVLENSNKESKIILEASSSNPDFIGGTIEEIGDIYQMIPSHLKKRVIFGLDTAHLFTKGIPLQFPGVWGNYLKKFDEVIGADKLAVIHLNDSETQFNSKKNFHAEVGSGYIFCPELGGSLESLREILKWAKKRSIPCILEKHDSYAEQIKLCYKVLNSKKKTL